MAKGGKNKTDLSDTRLEEKIQSMDNADNFSEYCIANPAVLLRTPQFNKGTAFTDAERDHLKIRGLLPYKNETIDVQIRRCLKQFRSFSEPMAKYLYLISLKERNHTLFYRLVIENLEEMLPIVYTPTVGQACLMFGQNYRFADGLYLTIADRKHLPSILQNWKSNKYDDVSIVVITDGSRILGLGDLGCNGMGIPMGKLSLYVACGGFHPSSTLPILLDVGTDNEEYLNDEFYLGIQQQRVDDTPYYEFFDEIMKNIFQRWPKCLLQFEDFSNQHCFKLLEKYRNKYLCFNDDIQGTGAVVAAAFLNAIKLAEIDIDSMRILFCGAGSAAIGVSDMIVNALVFRFKISQEKGRKMIYLVDSKGLITSDRGDSDLADFKKPYMRTDIKFQPNFKDLSETVKYVKPQAIIGLSAQANQFNVAVLKEMKKVNAKPIIFSLSNPTSNAECTFESAVNNTKGKCIFAAGSPFSPVKYDGKTHYSSQANNMYIFPGLGFGAWLCESSSISESMILSATVCLAESTSEQDLSEGRLFPALSQARKISAQIAADVFTESCKSGLASKSAQDLFKTQSKKTLLEFVSASMYEPDYFECHDQASLTASMSSSRTPRKLKS